MHHQNREIVPHPNISVHIIINVHEIEWIYLSNNTQAVTFLLVVRLRVNIGSRSLMDGLCIQRSKKASFESVSSSANCWARLRENEKRETVFMYIINFGTQTQYYCYLHFSLHFFLRFTGKCFPLEVYYNITPIMEHHRPKDVYTPMYKGIEWCKNLMVVVICVYIIHLCELSPI